MSHARFRPLMSWQVVIALASLYGVIVLVGISNTVGYHRLLTHRSFATHGWLRGALTILAAQYSGSPDGVGRRASRLITRCRTPRAIPTRPSRDSGSRTPGG